MKKVTKKPIGTTIKPQLKPEDPLKKPPESKPSKLIPQKPQEDDPKPKTLKDEVRIIDSLHTLMLQYAYSVNLLDDSITQQVSESESEIHDRGKQIIDLKKKVSSLKLESSAVTKNKILDDILSLEYSSLKPVEEDIITSSHYLKELQNNCLEFINRVDLERGAIISPKDLENQLEQSALDLNSLVSLVEDESKDMKNMANEFLELVSIVRAQHEALEDVRSLEKIINSNKLVEKVEVVKKVIGSRQAMIEKLIFEDF